MDKLLQQLEEEHIILITGEAETKADPELNDIQLPRIGIADA